MGIEGYPVYDTGNSPQIPIEWIVFALLFVGLLKFGQYILTLPVG